MIIQMIFSLMLFLNAHAMLQENEHNIDSEVNLTTPGNSGNLISTTKHEIDTSNNGSDEDDNCQSKKHLTLISQSFVDVKYLKTENKQMIDGTKFGVYHEVNGTMTQFTEDWDGSLVRNVYAAQAGNNMP